MHKQTPSGIHAFSSGPAKTADQQRPPQNPNKGSPIPPPPPLEVRNHAEQPDNSIEPGKSLQAPKERAEHESPEEDAEKNCSEWSAVHLMPPSRKGDFNDLQLVNATVLRAIHIKSSTLMMMTEIPPFWSMKSNKIVEECSGPILRGFPHSKMTPKHERCVATRRAFVREYDSRLDLLIQIICLLHLILGKLLVAPPILALRSSRPEILRIRRNID
jgi:hypothetical protein